MNAAAILNTCASADVILTANGGRLEYDGPDAAVERLLPILKAHKADLLALLAANDAPLPARVRQRFRDCCARLGIEPEPILRQFDYWKYTARDLQDMDAWPDEIVETHTRLLLSEVTDGLP